MTPMTTTPLRLGTWVRTGALVGLVASVDGDEVAVFDPTARQLTKVTSSQVQPVPAGALSVRAEVDLPLPHGLDEHGLRRWLASLLDPAVRERATTALVEQGLDEGAALPQLRLTVAPAEGPGAVCLCGRRAPAPDGEALACPACGRQAVARPTSARSPGDGAG